MTLKDNDELRPCNICPDCAEDPCRAGTNDYCKICADITTYTLRARVDELSLAIKMAGKVFVSGDKVLADLTSLGMGDPDNISAEVLKTRLTTLTAHLNHQKSQKEGE